MTYVILKEASKKRGSVRQVDDGSIEGRIFGVTKKGGISLLSERKMRQSTIERKQVRRCFT